MALIYGTTGENNMSDIQRFSNISYNGQGGTMSYGGQGSTMSQGLGVYNLSTEAIPSYNPPAYTPLELPKYDREKEKPYYQESMAPMMSALNTQSEQAMAAINASDNPNVKAQMMRNLQAGRGQGIAAISGQARKEAITEARTDWQAAQQTAQLNWQAKLAQEQQTALLEYQRRAENVRARNQANYQSMMASLQAAGIAGKSSGSSGGSASRFTGYGTGSPSRFDAPSTPTNYEKQFGTSPVADVTPGSMGGGWVSPSWQTPTQQSSWWSNNG